MGIVSEYLRDLVAAQIQEHGLVVWFDPEGHYQEFAAGLRLPGVAVARYEGSFFALRHAISLLLDGERPGRLGACRRESGQPRFQASDNPGRHGNGANGPLIALKSGRSTPETGLSDRLLVIYVAGLTEGETQGALVELTAPGMVMAPGQNPPEANTRFLLGAATL